MSEGVSRNVYIEDLCFIMPLKTLRTTPNVAFYQVDGVVEGLSGVDLVVHGKEGRSPMIEGDDTWYWYMHTDQEDKLLVHSGHRVVQLYSEKHGQVEQFEVSSEAIFHNGEKFFDGAAILGWSPYVFHRVHSPEVSVSTNYASRLEGFNIDTNFNIYNLNPQSEEYQVARIGAADQPKENQSDSQQLA